MATDYNALLGTCSTKPAAPKSELKQLNQRFKKRLPTDYLELLTFSNGLEGFIDEEQKAYLVIWPTDEFASLNEGYAVDEFAPGLVLIGSNGGDDAYAIDIREKDVTYVRVSLVGMDLDEIVVLGTSIEEFVASLLADVNS